MEFLKRARWLGASLTLAVIALLAMHEIGRTIGDVVVSGVTYPVSSLSGITQFWSAGVSIHAWAVAACSGIPVKAWLGWHTGFDLLFIVGYGVLATGANNRWSLHSKGWIALLVGADLVEDGLTAIAIALMPHGRGCGSPADPVNYHIPGALGGLLIAATAIKWLAAGGLVLHVLWVITRPPGLYSRIRVTLLALGVQRFPLIVAAILAVLLVLPGAPVLEQGIDVERAWVLNADLWLGIASAAWAVVFMVALALVLRYLGSVRVAPFEPPVVDGVIGAEPEPTPVTQYRAVDPKPGLAGSVPWWGKAFWASIGGTWGWLLAAGLVAIGTWVLGLTPYVRVYWRSAMWVAIVLAAIPVLSAALALIKSRPSSIDVADEDVRKKAYQVGRALAWSVPAILAVSVCRSLVAPVMLLPEDRLRCAVVFAVCALAACGYVFWFLGKNQPQLRSLGSTDPTPFGRFDPQLVGARKPDVSVPGAPPVPGPAWSIGPAAGLTAICAAVLLIWPVHMGRFFGVIGVVGLCLILLTAFYALLQILAQLSDAPHVFRLLGVQRAPVVAIVLIIGILSTLFATGTSQHEIRKPATASADQRPTLDAALETWLKNRSASCALDLPGAQNIHAQPLVMIAAEGGGIRAAWWTVDAMTSLTSTECGRNSIFLTSGVSGGAVGLGVMASTDDPYSRMKALAGDSAVAVATEGLMSRDLVAGAFGINVRAADGPADERFPDRAALIEQAWERQVPGLDSAFPRSSAAATVPWHTVFNGTSVANTCRVLVSDVKLTPTTSGCDDPANTVPGAYDLFDARPCDIGIRTSTASLLASRFPYVTPSGVITACGTKFTFEDQVIDGGYSENSGIETVNSMLTQLMPAIRTVNSAALNSGADPTVIVPVVMFLHNTVVASASDTPKTPKAHPEAFVPPSNQSDSGVLGKTSTLLQRAATIANDWVPDLPAAQARALRDGLQTTPLGARTMTVAPQQRPQIALPLGWTLSAATRKSLDDALDAYLTCKANDSRTCKQSSAFDALLTAWHTQMKFPLDEK